MNLTNIKLDDVRNAFEAVPGKGRDATFKGRVEANNDLHTHIQGLAPYRTFHLVTHSDFGESSGRLLVVSRSGPTGLVQEIRLPAVSETKPFFYHVNAFDSAKLSVRAVARVVRSKRTAAATHRATRAAPARKARRRPARRR